MDSLTHIALGACIGEAFFEKGFGRKAMIWGALAQSIPDIDFIASFWLGTTEDLLAHRGFTHSILFALLITPLFAYVADAIHRPHEIMFRKFLLFFAAEVFMHLFWIVLIIMVWVGLSRLVITVFPSTSCMLPILFSPSGPESPAWLCSF
jgi:membrane-bound metal-dependent hydrolase YbcI (DUF457 family)